MQALICIQALETIHAAIRLAYNYCADEVDMPVAVRDQNLNGQVIDLGLRVVRLEHRIHPGRFDDREMARLELFRRFVVLVERQNARPDNENPAPPVPAHVRVIQFMDNAWLIYLARRDVPPRPEIEQRRFIIVLGQDLYNIWADAPLHEAPLIPAERARAMIGLPVEDEASRDFNYDQLEVLSRRISPEELLNISRIPDELQDDPILSQFKCAISRRAIRYPVLVEVRGVKYLCEREELLSWKPHLGNDTLSCIANSRSWNSRPESYIPNLFCTPYEVMVIQRLFRPAFTEIQERLKRIGEEMARHCLQRNLFAEEENDVQDIAFRAIAYLSELHASTQDMVDELGKVGRSPETSLKGFTACCGNFVGSWFNSIISLPIIVYNLAPDMTVVNPLPLLQAALHSQDVAARALCGPVIPRRFAASRTYKTYRATYLHEDTPL